VAVTLVAVCVAAIRVKMMRITVSFGAETDSQGLIGGKGGGEGQHYGTVVDETMSGGDPEGERPNVGAVDEERGLDVGSPDVVDVPVFAADVKISWIGTGSALAIVNTSYRTAYEDAGVGVVWTAKPWVVSWVEGFGNEREHAAVMVAPLTGRVYTSGALRAYSHEIVDRYRGRDGRMRATYYTKKRTAEQAAMAAFMQGEGGPGGFLDDGVYDEGMTADMPNWVVDAVERRVALVQSGLEMDELTTTVGRIEDDGNAN
jgi:hypothetical protein